LLLFSSPRLVRPCVGMFFTPRVNFYLTERTPRLAASAVGLKNNTLTEIPETTSDSPTQKRKKSVYLSDTLKSNVLVALERFLPFAGRVIPEDHSVSVEAEVQTVVDAFFGHGSKTIQ